MNVVAGSRLTNQHTLHIDKVTTGSLIHVKTATISVVTAGAIVIAETITGLEKIAAGAIVITKYPQECGKHNITLTDGGRLYSTIDECIQDLTSKKEAAETESQKERLQQKINKVDQFEMW